MQVEWQQMIALAVTGGTLPLAMLRAAKEFAAWRNRRLALEGKRVDLDALQEADEATFREQLLGEVYTLRQRLDDNAKTLRGERAARVDCERLRMADRRRYDRMIARLRREVADLRGLVDRLRQGTAAALQPPQGFLDRPLGNEIVGEASGR